MNIIRSSNPDRFGYFYANKIVLMQIDDDSETLTIVESKYKKAAEKADTLFEGTFDEFNDVYPCVELGCFEFELGFKKFIQEVILTKT